MIDTTSIETKAGLVTLKEEGRDTVYVFVGKHSVANEVRKFMEKYFPKYKPTGFERTVILNHDDISCGVGYRGHMGSLHREIKKVSALQCS